MQHFKSFDEFVGRNKAVAELSAQVVVVNVSLSQSIERLTINQPNFAENNQSIKASHTKPV